MYTQLYEMKWSFRMKVKKDTGYIVKYKATNLE
jgi:hypothetical protein